MKGPIRLLVVICVVLMAAWRPVPRPLAEASGIRYDGVYRSEGPEWTTGGGTPGRVWSYLRFTPGAMVVLFVTDQDEPERLGNFSVLGKRLPYGTVTERDGRISFSTSEPRWPVVVDYEGHVEGDRLYLRSYSHFNGHRADRVFAFIPVPAATLRRWDGERP